MTFVVHVLALETMTIHPSWIGQIVALQYDKASTEILAKYSDYANVFSFDLVMELPENMGMNKYVIEFKDEKQPPYRPIYTLSSVKLKTLKTYIKTHLKPWFI